MKRVHWGIALLIGIAVAAFWWAGGSRTGSHSGAPPGVDKASNNQAPPATSRPAPTPVPEAPDLPPSALISAVTPGAVMGSATPEPAAAAGATGSAVPGAAPAASIPTGVPPVAGMPAANPAAPPVPGTQLTPPTLPPSPPTLVEAAKVETEDIALNIRQFMLRFGGNPVGTNADIVRELDGGNPANARYLPPELKRLNNNGELVDPWGTPYFFHQLSAKEMEVRSAGPDKIMWTADDILTK